jgi:hypothetical protein
LENHVADSFQEQAASVPQLWPWCGKGRMTREMAMIRSDLMLGRLLRHHPRYANSVPEEPIEAPQNIEIIPTPRTINQISGRPSVRSIQRVVSDFYEISLPDILSQRRKKEIIFARHIGMYLAKQLTPLPFQHIGRLFGDRDHSTVMNAVDSIERKRTKCERLNDDIEVIVLRIKHGLVNRGDSHE